MKAVSSLRMKRRTLAVTVAIALAIAAWPASASRYMSVDEVRAGMVGVGRTVFEGDRVEEFTVRVLGVLRNTAAPRRNLIIARLGGGPLADTGVIAGMSGSPVYIDGRLLGAVAYSLGQFSKEPIAGITPIDEMVEAAAPAPRRSLAGIAAGLDLPLTTEKVAAALRQAFSRFRQPFADSPADVRLEGLAPPDEPRGTQLGVLMRPIATPLALGGFSGPLRDLVSRALGDAGFVPMPDQPSAPGASPAHRRAPVGAIAALKPGDPVGVNLITGDIVLGATGTVTEVDGEAVYAFGHSFYNLGTTEFPMTRAFVFALLPSLQSSTKIAATGETIGTFRQDRYTAVAGTLGKGPDLIPIRIALDTERGLHKAFEFHLVDDQLFTPLLAQLVVLNTLSAYEREFGVATFTVKGGVAVRGHGEVALDDVFAGESAATGAAMAVAAPLAVLMGNDAERAAFDGVDLRITTSERPRTSTVERAWIDTPTVRPGSTITLKVLLRTYRGEEVVRTMPIEIPATASGSLSVLVSDGPRLAQMEQRDTRAARPQTLDQLVRLLNTARRSNRLYVRLLLQETGAVINGEALAGLPPSVLGVMESDRNGGSFSILRTTMAGEWELAFDGVVSGSRTLTITIQSH
jgi:hypothetical protein